MAVLVQHRGHRGHERLRQHQKGKARQLIRSDAAAAELAAVRRDADAAMRFIEVEKPEG